MYLFFELLEVLLLRLVLLLLNVGLGAVRGSDTLWQRLALEAGGRVRFHGGSKALGSAWDASGTRADAHVG